MSKKQFFKILVVALFAIIPLSGYCDNPIGLINQPVPPPKDMGEGHRAPAHPIYCYIDFETGEISIPGYDASEIESYEIWDADNTVCYVSTPDMADFVSHLSEVNGTVLVIFYFDGFRLSGYY